MLEKTFRNKCTHCAIIRWCTQNDYRTWFINVGTSVSKTSITQNSGFKNYVTNNAICHIVEDAQKTFEWLIYFKIDHLSMSDVSRDSFKFLLVSTWPLAYFTTFVDSEIRCIAWYYNFYLIYSIYSSCANAGWEILDEDRFVTTKNLNSGCPLYTSFSEVNLILPRSPWWLERLESGSRMAIDWPWYYIGKAN